MKHQQHHKPTDPSRMESTRKHPAATSFTKRYSHRAQRREGKREIQQAMNGGAE